MKKTYDQILDEVALECRYDDFNDIMESRHYDGAKKVAREAAERYRAQVDLPSDKDLHKMTDSKYEPLSYLAAGYFNGLRDMRDHIKSQLKQGI